MKIYVGSIIITIMILILAAIIIFWKPGKKSRYRFIRLAAGNLLIHLADGFITYVNTPGLEREGNPLVSKLGFGWGADTCVWVDIGYAGYTSSHTEQYMAEYRNWSFCRYVLYV